MQLGQLVQKALWLSFWETAAVPRVAESMFDDVPAPKKVATAEEKQEAKALISSLRKQASKEAKEKQRIGR